MKSIILIIMLLLCQPLFSDWFSSDKVMHFAGSTYLTYWNYSFSRDMMNFSHDDAMLYSIGFTLALGSGKELSDKYLKTTGWSWKDMLYNCAGIITGMIIINNTR